MVTLDAAVLVGHTATVARGAHPVVLAQRLITLGQVLLRGLAKVAERRRQAVGTVFRRGAAKRPQRLLQAAAEGAERLAAHHHGGVLEAGVGQPEVVQQVPQRRAGDDAPQVVGGGEVRQPQASGRMDLREHHLLVGAVPGAPVAHAAFQRAAHPRRQFRVPAQQFLKDRCRAQLRRALQQRDYFFLLAHSHLDCRWTNPPAARRARCMGRGGEQKRG